MTFTGLVEEMGVVRRVAHRGDGTGCDITVESDGTAMGGCKLGDSIAVNGVCLTVTAFDEAERTLQFGLAPETLRRTNLGDLAPGQRVNLERALLAGARVGGHNVQGHVDGTGTISRVEQDGESLAFTVAVAPEIARYVVEKGYIAVDGTSLTVTEVTDTSFSYMLVPYTQGKVVQAKKRPGDRVNIEVDLLAKYVERFVDKMRARL